MASLRRRSTTARRSCLGCTRVAGWWRGGPALLDTRPQRGATSHVRDRTPIGVVVWRAAGRRTRQEVAARVFWAALDLSIPAKFDSALGAKRAKTDFGPI